MYRSRSAGVACSASRNMSPTRKDRARSIPSPSVERRRCRSSPNISSAICSRASNTIPRTFRTAPRSMSRPAPPVTACPGVDKGGNVKNLGYTTTENITNLKDIVFKGPFMDKGMPDFTGKLTDADVVKIQAFIQGTADAVRPKACGCRDPGRKYERRRSSVRVKGGAREQSGSRASGIWSAIWAPNSPRRNGFRSMVRRLQRGSSQDHGLRSIGPRAARVNKAF